MVLNIYKDEEGKISSLYDSSNILASKYDPETKKMVIIFGNGGQFLYENVTINTFNQFQNSKSQGSTFHSIIKGHHSTKLGKVDVNPIIEDIKNLKTKNG